MVILAGAAVIGQSFRRGRRPSIARCRTATKAGAPAPAPVPRTGARSGGKRSGQLPVKTCTLTDPAPAVQNQSGINSRPPSPVD